MKSGLTKPGERPQDFDAWWESDGKYYDPDWDDIDWYDKRKGLAEYAWHKSREAK